jgi:hypothetical protein
MSIELRNGYGKVYLITGYDADNHWVYNEWIGYQTYASVAAGAEACLPLLRDHACPYLLNDNRRVIGPWDFAVTWIVTYWVPRAIELGLTHFANIISPEAMAALSARAMQTGIGDRLQLRLFDRIEEAQAWLREAREAAGKPA